MSPGRPAKKSPRAPQGELFGASPNPVPPERSGAESKGPPGGEELGTRPADPKVDPPPRAPAPPTRTVLTVGELTARLKGLIETSFPRVLVRGEISGFRGPNARGHLYFTLKDEDACLDAKIWASTAQRLRFALRDGLEVVAEGSVDLYAPQGRYSLIIQRLEPAGEGALALAFQQLKERLTAEGLMGEKRLRPPRPIPFWPKRIGVVTSRTGAALQDFLRVLHARNPKMRVLLADARVQGEGAAVEVARAIDRLSRTDVDVIVVTRGGGSLEDLWTFNEELVARAIHACPVPVVSAIGHEVDFTIADFVADLRCPTPSAAAERLAPVLRELELGLKTQYGRLAKAAERHVLHERRGLGALAGRLSDPRRLLGQKRIALGDDADRIERAARRGLRRSREELAGLSERLERVRPQAQLARHQHALRDLKDRLAAAGWAGIEVREERLRGLAVALERRSPLTQVRRERDRSLALRQRLIEATRARLSADGRHLHGLISQLEAMSPLKVMARGYAVVFGESGHVVRRAKAVKPGETLRIKLAGQACETLSDCEEIRAQVLSSSGRGEDEG